MMNFDDVRAAWPGVSLSAADFEVAWRQLSDTADPGLEAHAPDLYLAVACRANDPVALGALQRLVEAQLPAFDSFRLSAADGEELCAKTMALLVVGKGGTEPKLAQYAARGPLSGWIHVLMTRLLLDERRATKAKVSFDDDALLGLSGGAANPELELLRERFRGQFSQAFREAMAALSPRERNLLRQYYLDDLSLEDLSAMYRAHRVTISRWLSGARAALVEKTRDGLAQRAGLGRLEVDSVMRVVVSRLDLSASLFLGQEPS